MLKTVTVAVVASQGTGSDDEQRILALLERADASIRSVPFARASKLRSARRLFSISKSDGVDLVVLEGTGVAAGGALLLARALGGAPFVVSSGDPVGPWWSTRGRAAGLVGNVYERLLCRSAAGFIGWTPYLAGRALTFGSPTAITAPGWGVPAVEGEEDRRAWRERWGASDGDVVFGIVGSLNWSDRRQYCYGLELVEALKLTSTTKARVVVIGDGDGSAHLRERAAGHERITFTGRLPRSAVPGALRGFDVASLPQSVDRLGVFRYTTKLPEYLAAGLPVATSSIPAAFDIPGDWCFKVSNGLPWDARYHEELAHLMDRLDLDALDAKRRGALVASKSFDREEQQRRVAAYVAHLTGPGR